MSTLKISFVKAFTRDPVLGNPAVVIEGSVDAEETLAAVREAECSVAAVIDSHASGKIPIRFFYENGAVETFACGHATLAAAECVLPDQESEAEFVNMKGRVIKVRRSADGRISQKQQVPCLSEQRFETDEVAQVLGVKSVEILHDWPIQVVGSPGKMKLMVPVSLQTLLGLKRNSVAVIQFCKKYSHNGCVITGIFPFAMDTADCDAHARHFPNRDEEDLVCGVGALALAQYFQAHGEAKDEYMVRCGPGEKGVGDVIVRLQGREIFLEGWALADQ